MHSAVVKHYTCSFVIELGPGIELRKSMHELFSTLAAQLTDLRYFASLIVVH